MKKNQFISRILLVLAMVAMTSNRARADQLRFESGEKRVAFVELFTSEGCSSCPPAERALSTLATHPSLWKTFVPVAFHVNYWDNLGWKDQLASVEFTQRQHTYASGWRSDTVYTPEFVLNGREWQWSGADTLARQSSETPGMLTVLQNGVGNHFVVTFNSTKPVTGQAIAHLALIGFGLTSDVARGENAGRKLTHDFVALAHHEAGLQGSPLRAELKLDENSGDSHPRAIAAWVSVGSDPTPIQATGGWISQAR
ncbi:MAG TPA: DUF1223 domain-containing protein [Candidatus Udaeobacter sp.]